MPLDPQVIPLVQERADLGTGGSDLLPVRDLAVANVTQAIALGILVGDAAVRQILTGAPGPLGRREGQQ